MYVKTPKSITLRVYTHPEPFYCKDGTYCADKAPTQTTSRIVLLYE